MGTDPRRRASLQLDAWKAEEQTLSFRQMIFNKDGRMIESHAKFPNDTGHKIIGAKL